MALEIYHLINQLGENLPNAAPSAQELGISAIKRHIVYHTIFREGTEAG